MCCAFDLFFSPALFILFTPLLSPSHHSVLSFIYSVFFLYMIFVGFNSFFVSSLSFEVVFPFLLSVFLSVLFLFLYISLPFSFFRTPLCVVPFIAPSEMLVFACLMQYSLDLCCSLNLTLNLDIHICIFENYLNKLTVNMKVLMYSWCCVLNLQSLSSGLHLDVHDLHKDPGGTFQRELRYQL